jgi:phosphotransferase system HPr (HPr) family protein
VALSLEMQVVNPDGLHTRPAATIASAMMGFDARLSIANLRTGVAPRPLAGPISIMLLDAQLGDRLAVTAEGAQAQAAIDALADMIRGGFGELPSGDVSILG